MQPMATRRTNVNGVYLAESSSRQELCVVNRQAELSSSSSGQKTNACSRSEDKPVSQRQEPEPSMGASDNIDSLVANSIGRLIFEAGLEPGFVHLPSFNGVIDLLTRGVRIAMPSYEYILQVQIKEVQQRDRALRQHWEKSGCSVILDSWKSRCGKRFVSVFVHCREGMLFLRSMDTSTIFDDVDELATMVCHVIEDIGVRNIVQVIINDVSPHMQAAEHAVLKRYEQSFIFTVCADHCIDLLLENIAALDNVKDVLTKAKEITRFLYGHALPMELKRLYIGDAEIISNSNLKCVAMFDTLEKLVSWRENLVEMFNSADWVSSDLASTNLSMGICEVVQMENAFWSAAAHVLKVTGPLIRVLYKLEDDKCPVSVLYDAMDNAKEEIKQNLGDEHDSYWQMIDHIWDDYLHSPVHAAGYFLNPAIFYTVRFRNDAEISSGITTCILRAAKSHYDALLVAEQMDVYLRKSGQFDSDPAIEEAVGTPQDLWWVKHGTGTPALQSFAGLILGQTCYGVSRYNLDRSLSERLHTEKMAYTERERFRSMEYVYYNLRLASSVPRVAGPPAAQHGKLTTQLGDWVSA
ncbi:uncharacterized protein LOC101752579 [Setaria italica]|uniref:uncharacterized protein LOC101752579 n=1 Tax=Setaria italica TaxID=4555 RepID=UPI000350E431|nr:uncharacterized protein LOC101752579 [Setaria italica]XP_014660492.1 uncharacterized protein LOC101752579 [Setaria italica]